MNENKKKSNELWIAFSIYDLKDFLIYFRTLKVMKLKAIC